MEKTGCHGDREITGQDGDCEVCKPYTKAQEDNTVCRSDECGANQIITWLGTCADCEEGTRPDDNRGTCVGTPTRLNALVELDAPEEKVSAAPEAAKKRSFPTVLVAGLSVLVLILSGAAGFIYLRNRGKGGQPVEQVNEQVQEG